MKHSPGISSYCQFPHTPNNLAHNSKRERWKDLQNPANMPMLGNACNRVLGKSYHEALAWDFKLLSVPSYT